MYIKQLKLHGVGKFEQPAEFAFKEGLNLLTGANEAGKSTIVKAIETSLFGFKPMKDWKYASWQEKETIIECMISQKNEETLITRRYGSKIRGTTLAGHIAENIGNQPIEGHLVDLELYKAMFSISVDELAGIDKKSWKELTASLTDAYNHSAFKSAAEAQETVEQKASEIYRENGRGQFEMKRLQEDQTELSNQIKQLEIERSYAVRSEEEVKEIRRQVERLGEQIQQIDERIRHYEENHQRIRRRREYRQKLADYQHIESLDLPDKPLLERWVIELEREGHVDNEIKRIEQELERLRNRVAEVEASLAQFRAELPKKRTALAVALILALLGYGVYSLPEGLNELEQMIIGVLGVLSLALALNVGFVSSKNKREELRVFDQKLVSLGQSIALAEMQLHHFEDEREDMLRFQAPLKEACERLGMSGPKEMLEWATKASYLATALDTLLEQEEDPDGFLESIMEGSSQKAPEEVALKALLDERDSLTSLKAEQEQKLSHNTNLGVKEIDYRLSALKEKQNTGHQQLLATAFKRDKLLLVSKIVSEAEKLYRKSQKPDFLIRASRYMNQLSNGRYEEILMSEGGGFVLRTSNELIPMGETISRGTKEQMYLALKLAMTFRLDPLGYYPILMDEIAINFDRDRRQGLYRLLSELSEHRQILYLTCHDWQVAELNKAMESHVIELK